MAYTAQVLQAAALALLAYILTYLYQSYRSSLAFQAFARANNCQPPVFSPTYLPWGLDRIYKILTYKGGDFLDDFIFARLKSQGRWTVISPAFAGSFTVMTAEPRNIQAILSTKFADFGVGKRRYQQFWPLLGYGIFTADGPVWEHSRAILRPQFSRDQVNDLQAAEKHMQRLFHALPTSSEDGWTEPTDLAPLFLRFMLDLATEWLFGKSVDSQLAALHNNDSLKSPTDSPELPPPPFSDLGRLERSFDAAFRTAQETIAWRVRMQGLYWLIDSRKFRNACAVCHSWADYFVAEALKAKRDGDAKRVDDAKRVEDETPLFSPPTFAARARAEVEVEAEAKPKYSVLASMLDQTSDPPLLRSQSISLLLAGRDSTARLLSFIFLELARHPDVWKALRADVLATFGPDPSFPTTTSTSTSASPVHPPNASTSPPSSPSTSSSSSSFYSSSSSSPSPSPTTLTLLSPTSTTTTTTPIPTPTTTSHATSHAPSTIPSTPSLAPQKPPQYPLITPTTIRTLPPLLHSIISETLRLYPLVPLNNRTALRPTILPLGGGPHGLSPLAIPAGTVITYSPYVVHRREDIWGADAGVWRPGRWGAGDGDGDGIGIGNKNGNGNGGVGTGMKMEMGTGMKMEMGTGMKMKMKEGRNGGAGRKSGWGAGSGGEYVPFNAGPRVCVGMGWATAVAGWVVVRMAQRFERIEGAVGVEGFDKEVPVKKVATLTLAPVGGVGVRLKGA